MPVYVYPPEHYLDPCLLSYPDTSIAGVQRSLIAGIECERAGKAGIRAWITEHKQETTRADNTDPPPEQGSQ